MGCPLSKISRRRPSQPVHPQPQKVVKFINISEEKPSRYHGKTPPPPVRAPSSRPIPPPIPAPSSRPMPPPIPAPSSRPIPPPLPTLSHQSATLKRQVSSLSSKAQPRVQLHTPIYVAIKSYCATDDSYLSFEKDDEMELIKEVNSSELCVNHLRSGERGIVLTDFVKLHVDTPLRLAVTDPGIIQQCLMQHNVLGAYLIRRSTSIAKAFVLSIAQYNEQYNTFYWHYIICTDPSNNRFYFSQEQNLKHISFSSFQQLISSPEVRRVIPLTEIVPYAVEFDEDVWKIPFDQLTIEEKIGEGQFGEVYRGSWHKPRQTIPIAVKKLCIRQVTKTIEREIEAMKKLNNLYVVSMYGVAEKLETNEIYIITELMENGDLKSWLKNLTHLPEHSILTGFAKDISTGMTYLELRNYVHRDLACRNILLSSRLHSVKIADFGLSVMVDKDNRHRSEEAQQEKLPIRWLAPELLVNPGAYSIKSDVWSFGIVLIEIWLKGGDPYNDKLIPWIRPAVIDGFIHEKPVDCPDDFYESVICKCLTYEAIDRPSFLTIKRLLER